MSVAGMVVAAGRSRRMGSVDKRRIAYRGRTLVENAIANLGDGGLDPVIVVLERDSPCGDLPGVSAAVVVENPDPERGMLSSIRCGLTAVPAAAPGVAVLPGDHPFVFGAVVDRLRRVFVADQPPLLVPRFAGKRGHPLFIARALFAEAIACDDAIGLRQLVWRYSKAIAIVDFDDENVDDDIDTPNDLTRLDRKP